MYFVTYWIDDEIRPDLSGMDTVNARAKFACGDDRLTNVTSYTQLCVFYVKSILVDVIKS
jgi:uncharacterized protein YacL (UPF0231 family)